MCAESRRELSGKEKFMGRRSLSTRILFFVSTPMVEGHFLSPTPRRNLLHLVTSVSFPLALDPRRAYPIMNKISLHHLSRAPILHSLDGARDELFSENGLGATMENAKLNKFLNLR